MDKQLLTKTYIIPVKPIAWQRAGVNFQNHNFYDTQVHLKNSIRIFIQQQHGDNRPYHKGPIRADREYYFPIPKTISKRPQSEGMWMITVPDIDQLDKFIFDTMKCEGILSDDRYICDGSHFKKYSKTPRIVITLTELP